MEKNNNNNKLQRAMANKKKITPANEAIHYKSMEHCIYPKAFIKLRTAYTQRKKKCAYCGHSIASHDVRVQFVINQC